MWATHYKVSWLRVCFFLFYSFSLKILKQPNLIDELSLDPHVRTSPFIDPPENEIKLTWNQIFGTRLARIYFMAFHLMALLALYYCLIGQVKLFTILWSK